MSSTPPPLAQCIPIIGPSGAGRTALGLALGERLDPPLADLDDRWRSPGWVECGHAAQHEPLSPLAASPRWIVGGNHGTGPVLHADANEAV